MIYAYVLYYLLMNILTYILYAMDKKRAIRRQWRVPESVLLGLSLLGGCVGAFIAMHNYHHKTRHWRFAMGVPAMILLHGSIIVYFLAKTYWL